MILKTSLSASSKALRITLLGLLPLLGGCISLPLFDNDPAPVETQVNKNSSAASAQNRYIDGAANGFNADSTSNNPALVDSLWNRVRNNMQLSHIEHPRIAKYRKQFQKRPHSFTALISRAEPYLFYILNEIENRGMPAEFALLPAVESAFQPYAASSTGAAGLWQIMPTTGRYLGLKNDRYCDQRRDVRLATATALDYLQSRAKRFNGDWLHAMAAYNAGAGRVNRAIRKAKRKQSATDYWSLDLPAETDAYIPKLLAFSQIVMNPEKYGFSLPDFPDQPYFGVAPIPGQIDLRIAAEAAELSLESLLELNPGFNRWATNPQGPHELLVPLAVKDKFVAAVAALPEPKRLRWHQHTVKHGDVLGKIARQYDVPASLIKQNNQLKSHRIHVGQVLTIPASDALVSLPGKKIAATRPKVRYEVRRGDSLYKIARKFQVKITDLKRWNRVGKYLQPGQRLTVYLDPSRQI